MAAVEGGAAVRVIDLGRGQAGLGQGVLHLSLGANTINLRQQTNFSSCQNSHLKCKLDLTE